MNIVLNPSKKLVASLTAVLWFDACSDDASTPTETEQALCAATTPLRKGRVAFGRVSRHADGGTTGGDGIAEEQLFLSDSKVVNAQLGLWLRGA